ncbi:MAG TPA: glycosyltransferase [Solirubrobacteraceae bacterium]|nr:glycosyltransferase [Solirubrobacteraceae bacterium]
MLEVPAPGPQDGVRADTTEIVGNPAADARTLLGVVAPPVERRRSRRRRNRHNRHLVPGLTWGQRIRLGCLIVAWSLLSVWAWTWWLVPAHSASPATTAISTGLLAFEMLFLPLWFFFWIYRMKRPNPALEPPQLRTAMVVTKAPSEPWELVRETLEAMLAQDYPYPFDTWLADEKPAPETLEWCAAHAVRVSSREGVAAYHRPTWPRRTRCKEGNLAYFYDMWGYDLYDVVAQLDADHVPAPDYLRHMVVPFRDPLVGYVAAPSICDRNAAASWSARGRLWAEAVLHGPTQAGHSGGYAPSCIGSHYAVRTAALREVGGLGPELAEDFTTTLMLSSHRWQGVFAIDAEAHGDGPATFADCMTQEFQWSRSMMNVLLGINRRYRNGLSRAARIRLGFCLWWYPLFAFQMLASVLLPIVAIVTRTPFMQLSLGSFYEHFAPATLVLLAAVLWLRRLGWLRPGDARPVSWEMALFQLVRWPWALFGCLHAAAGRLAGREFSFKVTPKGTRAGVAPVPMRVVTPYLGLAAISALPSLLGLDAGAAHGYYTLATINVALYTTAAAAIIGLHVYEHPRRLRLEALRNCLAKFAVVGLSALTTACAAISPGLATRIGAHDAPAPRPVPAVAGAHPSLILGVTTDALAENSTTPWQAGDLGQVNAFEQAVHAHAGIVMWYADWRHAQPSLAQLRAAAARGSIPEISWEPWDYSGSPTHQPRFTLASIIAGRHDAYIRRWATVLRRFGRRVYLRFAQEMNGNWYPWSEAVNGNRPGQFVSAWRHVHRIFTELGAQNVRWIWSPAAGTSELDASLYPGPAYVDIVGVSVFNGGSRLNWGGWRSFARIFNQTARSLTRIAPGKPIQISEVSSAEAGGSKAAWITDMFAELHAHPQVTSLVWYNVRKQADWPVTSDRAAARAFAAGAHALRQTRG